MLDLFNHILETFYLSGFACLHFHFCRFWRDEYRKLCQDSWQKIALRATFSGRVLEQALSCT